MSSRSTFPHKQSFVLPGLSSAQKGCASPSKLLVGAWSSMDREQARSDPTSPEMVQAELADPWHTLAHCDSGYSRLRSEHINTHQKGYVISLSDCWLPAHHLHHCEGTLGITGPSTKLRIQMATVSQMGAGLHAHWPGGTRDPIPQWHYLPKFQCMSDAEDSRAALRPVSLRSPE